MSTAPERRSPKLDYMRLVIQTGHMKTINASEFKAKCLALLDEVSATGEVLTILKHGRPVAQVVPPAPRVHGFPQDALAGTVEFVGNVVEPALDPSAWEAEASGEEGR